MSVVAKRQNGLKMPPSKRAQPPPNFWLVYCDQTAGWIKMPLGMVVGFGPGDVVLDGDPKLPLIGAQPPVFGPCLLWLNGWMDEYATWY